VLFLIGWGSVQLTNVSETLFLKRVGVEYLPLVFLANSILLVATTGIAGRIATRVAHVPLLVWTLGGLAAVLLPLWLAVMGETHDAVFTVLLMAAKQIESIALLVFWVALGGLLHGRQAKRLYAPITAGATLGTILGSFASGPLGRVVGISALVPAAAVSLAAAACVTLPLRRMATGSRLVARPARTTPARETPPPRAAALWRESLLFRVMVSSTLLAGVLGPMLYFQFSYVADHATQGSNGEQRLLDLYAQFRGWINFAVLLLQLVGTSWIYRRIGVPLASVLSPLVYLLGFAGLSARLSLPAGIGAVAATNLQDHAITDPAQKILVTLFTERVRAYVTALIDGPIKRAGGVLGNAVVLGALAVGTPIWVGWTALPIAAAWLILAIVLWRAYPTILLEVVGTRGDDQEELPLGELIDPGTLRVLERSLVGGDRENCRAACGLLLEAPPDRTAGVLVRSVPRAPAANRPAIVAALDRLVHQHRDAIPVPTDGILAVAALLQDPAGLPPADRARLLLAYVALAGPLIDRALLTTLACDDPDGAVRLAARVASRDPQDENVDAVLAAATASTDPVEREVARDALRTLLIAPGAIPDARWRSRLAMLVDTLARPEDRAGAATVLAELAGRYGAEVAQHADALIAHGRDPDTRVREAVLRFVGHARLAEQAGWLVERVTAHDTSEAAAARDALRSLGPLAMDMLLEALHFGKRSTRLAILPLLREMAVDGRSLRALVDAELDCMQRTALHVHALHAGGVSDLVVQRLQERVTESAHTALLLLAALLDEDRIARLCRLLGRSSQDGRERAVLLEAIEALLPLEPRERLMPILEERDPAVRATAAARTLGRALPSFDEAMRDVLAGNDDLTRDFLGATLDAATRARFGFDPALYAPGSGNATGHAIGAPPGADGAPAGAETTDETNTHVLSKVEVVLHLRSLEIFGRLTTRQLTDLAAVVIEETHPSGTVVVQEGAFEDCMYLIVAGQVRITKADRTLAELGARDFFGEMAVFDGETRSATAVAQTTVRVLRLERHDLFLVMEEQPGIAITICQTLSRRLRELNERLRTPDRT
jgi:AAA family ATP:ADP antiporter